MAILFLGSACSKHQQDTKHKLESPMDRIRRSTELSLGSVGSPQHFFEKNPDYNPNWVAKVNLSEQEVLVLKDELNKKQFYPLENRGSLSAFVSWWTPKKTADKFQYITSYNAPVLIIISQEGRQYDVYIEWTSP